MQRRTTEKAPLKNLSFISFGMRLNLLSKLLFDLIIVAEFGCGTHVIMTMIYDHNAFENLF